MKMLKITYKTEEGKVFRTFSPVGCTDVQQYMNLNYTGVEVIKVRPSIKVKYKKYLNIEQKQLRVL
jgi:hypothetical protein